MYVPEMVRQWAGNVLEIKMSICKYMSGKKMDQKWPEKGPEMAQKSGLAPGTAPDPGKYPPDSRQ